MFEWLKFDCNVSLRVLNHEMSTLDICETEVEFNPKPAIAAMHGPHSLVRFGDYM